MSKRWITALFVVLFTIGFVRGGGVVVHANKGLDTLRGNGGDTILSTPTNHYIEAVKHLAIELDTLSAERSLNAALRLDSTYAPAMNRLSQIIFSQRREESYPEALEMCRKVYLSDTSNKEYVKIYSLLLVANDSLQEALAMHTKFTAMEPHNPDNHRFKAVLESSIGKDSLAVVTLDSAAVLLGRIPELERMKHHILLSMGQHERVLAECRRHIGEAPNDAYNYSYLGEVYSILKQDSLATLCHKKAIELGENDIAILSTAGDHFITTQNVDDYMSASRLIFAHPDMPLEQKLRIYNALITNESIYHRYFAQIWSLARILNQNYPTSPEVVDIYATYLIHAGNIEEALAHYKAHFDDQPPQLDYFLTASEIESYLERYDQASSTLDRAIELFPENRCELLLRKGHINSLNALDERAHECYSQALEVAPTDSLKSVCATFIGDLYQKMAQGSLSSVEESYRLRNNGNGEREWKKLTKRCYNAYEEALGYNPDNCAALNNYAYFLSIEGRNLERALTMATRATALEPNNATYLDTHSWVLYKLSRYDEAKRILQRALTLIEQPSAELQLHYGDILEALGEKFMAEVYWERALNNGADPKQIEQRKERIKGKTATK